MIDDVKAFNKYQKKGKCLLSVHIIYGLYYKGNITRVQAVSAIKDMRIKGTWMDSVIPVAARALIGD